MKHNQVIIIGAGIGGLATGIRLAADGYQVRIMEKSTAPGGWLKTTRNNGFRFSNGGLVLTMPQRLEELFAYTGRSQDTYLDLLPLDPILQVLTPGEKPFRFYREPANTVMKNLGFTLKEQQAYHDFGVRSDRIFDEVIGKFAEVPLKEKLLPFQPAFGFRRFRPDRSLKSVVTSRFETEMMRGALSVWPLFYGGNPDTMSHFSRMIPTALQRSGAFIPVGGPDALINALVRLFKDCGGDLILNAEVETIRIFNNVATGIRLTDGSVYQADAVISDMEAGAACRLLIDSDRTLFSTVSRAGKKAEGPGVFIYHIGLDHIPEEKQELLPINMILPRDPDKWQRTVFTEKALPEESVIQLRITGKLDASDVPEDRYGMTAIVTVPNLDSDIRWERESYRFRSLILDQLQTLFTDDLRSSLICESFITPEMIREENGAWLGSAWSFAPEQNGNTLPRITNRSEDIRNLYFVGNGAHPGPFIPAVLTGAALAHKAVVESR